MRVLDSEPFYHRMKLCVRSIGRVPIVLTMRLQTRPLNALSEPTFLSFAIKTLHSMLDLIDGFFLAIESLDADDVKHIADEIALYGHIKG